MAQLTQPVLPSGREQAAVTADRPRRFRLRAGAPASSSTADPSPMSS
ncbi:hypothetical protein GA0115240_14617 [Streptomyces sp. DvalAA-14]|nr:hypothetical protein GA0115240_14617 [Streptomyces sp. DvalAA-14]